MWPVIVVFLILLAIFLYWKFGTKVSLPGSGGLGAKMSGMLGSLSSTSESEGKRVEFSILLTFVLAGVAILVPSLYTWFWGNKGLAFFIAIITIVYIIKGPKSATVLFVLKMLIVAILLTGVYNGLNKENAMKEWFAQDAEPARTPAAAAFGGEILLTSKRSEIVEFIPLKMNRIYCSTPGVMMRIVYGGTDPEATVGPSGSKMSCPTQYETFSIGKKLYNVQFHFPTNAPGVTVTHLVL